MKRIGAPNLRWPGGCFADGYHWRDGIGPAARRPRTYNYWEHRMPAGFHATETQPVRHPRVHAPVPAGRGRALRGGQRRLGHAAGVPRLGVLLQRPRGDALSRRRARRQRRPRALQRQVLGRGQRVVGLRRQHVRRRVRHASTASTSRSVPVYVRPFFVATGPRGHSADCDIGWTEGFFAGLQSVRGLGVRVDGFALHYYTDFRQTAEDGARFDAQGLVRGPAQGRAHRERDRRPLAHHGELRPRAPHALRDRRVGQLVQGRHRARAARTS